VAICKLTIHSKATAARGNLCLRPTHFQDEKEIQGHVAAYCCFRALRFSLKLLEKMLGGSDLMAE
jgi:hypothetical protein